MRIQINITPTSTKYNVSFITMSDVGSQIGGIANLVILAGSLLTAFVFDKFMKNLVYKINNRESP